VGGVCDLQEDRIVKFVDRRPVPERRRGDRPKGTAAAGRTSDDHAHHRFDRDCRLRGWSCCGQSGALADDELSISEKAPAVISVVPGASTKLPIDQAMSPSTTGLEFLVTAPDGRSVGSVEVELGDSLEGFQRRAAELSEFEPDPALAGEQCSDLSVSNGSIQVDATGSRLAKVVQVEQPIPSTDLRLVVRFGSGFPSFTCTDLESEMRDATVDEEWAASATRATFTVVVGERCSTAALELYGVVAQAPDGQHVELGDIVITNRAWQWWHPFECQLLATLGER
jgi:hypothetical protein